MSTSYYRLRNPVKLVSVEPGAMPNTTRVGFVLEGMSTWAHVIAPEPTATEFVRLLFNTSEAGVLLTYYGGKGIGTIVAERKELPRNAVVLSEHGEVTTVNQVWSKSGMGA